MAYASRKYIDLIRKADTKWANWDPSLPHPEVGDYGTVDRETGLFEKDGSVYDLDDPLREHFPDMGKYPPEDAIPDDQLRIHTNNARQVDFSVGPQISIVGLADASLKEKWKFSSRRGALLIMVKPRHTFIPPGCLGQLARVEELADKRLVTNVVRCPAYALYLSSNDGDELALALTANVPVPSVPGLSAGGAIGGSWWSSASSGILKTGGHLGNTYDYTPLFVLKEIQKPHWWAARARRGISPSPHNGDNLWANAQVPWDMLDENGNEHKIVADEELPDF